jgi:hypothetical protein
MKRTLTLLAVAGSAAAILPATASARSNYCSTSGDVCYGIVKNSSPIQLQIVTQAKYFSTYRLCIKGPDGKTDCRRFKIKKAARGTYQSTVTWPKHYPYRGRGKYKATWFASGNKLGPAVTF